MLNNKRTIFAFFLMISISAAFLWCEDGRNAKSYLDSGINLYKDEKYFEAIDSFRNAIEINPYYGDAFKYMADVYFSLGEYRTSLDNSLLALKYANNDPEAILLVANSYRELGTFDKSEQFYKKIIDLSPDYVEAYRNLAELYMKMNKLSLALSMLNKAERINKGYWKNYISFGNYYIKTSNPGKAESYYKDAYNLNPTDRLVYTTLGEFYLNNGNYASAIRLLESGEKIFENFYSGIVILADSYLKAGNYKQAIQKYEWIDQSNFDRDAPFKARLYYKMAFAYETLDKSKVVEYYQKSISQNPNDEFVEYSLETFVLKNLKIDDPVREELAKDHLDKAKENLKQGDNKFYLLHLKRAVSLFPFLTEARRSLVNYYESRNDYFSAYQELKSLSKIDTSYKVKDKLENYEWKVHNKKLRLEKPNYYSYKGAFLTDADLYNFADVYSDILQYNAEYYDKFKFSALSFRKTQGIKYILEYLRENGYTFFVIANLDNVQKTLKYTIYDKTGKAIDSYTVPFKLQEMNNTIVRFLDWMDTKLPSIWIIGNELVPNRYSLSAGTMNKINNNDKITAIEFKNGSIDPISLLGVKKVDYYSSELSVISNFRKAYYDSLTDKFAIQSDFLSKKDLTKFKRILGY